MQLDDKVCHAYRPRYICVDAVLHMFGPSLSGKSKRSTTSRLAPKVGRQRPTSGSA
jgi:hypothetical protein